MSTTITKTKEKPDPTKSILATMLRTNTGSHFLDSGIASGRNHERNRGRDFEAESAAYLSVMVVDTESRGRLHSFSCGHRTFHWLAERLSYAPKMDRMFQRFAKSQRDSERELAIMQAFPKSLIGKRGRRVTSLDGEEVEEFLTNNTYNGDDALDQTIQYVYFEVEEKDVVTSYVLLQIHGGCDVRGGYTDAKCFELTDEHSSFFDNASITLQGQRPEGDRAQMTFDFMAAEDKVDTVWWESDNGGYSFRFAGNYNAVNRRIPDIVADESCLDHRDGFPFTTDMSKRGEGYVVVDEENNKVYCPITGWELTPM